MDNTDVACPTGLLVDLSTPPKPAVVSSVSAWKYRTPKPPPLEEEDDPWGILSSASKARQSVAKHSGNKFGKDTYLNAFSKNDDLENETFPGFSPLKESNDFLDEELPCFSISAKKRRNSIGSPYQKVTMLKDQGRSVTSITKSQFDFRQRFLARLEADENLVDNDRQQKVRRALCTNFNSVECTKTDPNFPTKQNSLPSCEVGKPVVQQTSSATHHPPQSPIFRTPAPRNQVATSTNAGTPVIKQDQGSSVRMSMKSPVQKPVTPGVKSNSAMRTLPHPARRSGIGMLPRAVKTPVGKTKASETKPNIRSSLVGFGNRKTKPSTSAKHP